jgi:hypothetical protein
MVSLCNHIDDYFDNCEFEDREIEGNEINGDDDAWKEQ